MKKCVFSLITTLLFTAFSFSVSALEGSPVTGAETPMFLPIAIGLIVLAVVALVVCMILLKKKK